jgi:Domain of unknown function (DUF4386)
MNEHSKPLAPKIAGALFIAAILCYGTGTAFLESYTRSPIDWAALATQPANFRLGAFLALLNSFCVLGIGALMLPTLKRSHPVPAYFYFGARVLEAVLLLLGLVFLYLQLPLANAPDEKLAALLQAGNAYAYQVAMCSLGLGSLPFCYVLYREILVPRWLGLWGFLGYAVFFCGAVLELWGQAGVGIPMSIPGGLFELTFGIWLLLKGLRDKTS